MACSCSNHLDVSRNIAAVPPLEQPPISEIDKIPEKRVSNTVGFKSIPVELRNLVYTHSIKQSCEKPGLPRPSSGVSHSIECPLLLLNKQIHNEYKEVFYQIVSFTVRFSTVFASPKWIQGLFNHSALHYIQCVRVDITNYSSKWCMARGHVLSPRERLEWLLEDGIIKHLDQMPSLQLVKLRIEAWLADHIAP